MTFFLDSSAAWDLFQMFIQESKKNLQPTNFYSYEREDSEQAESNQFLFTSAYQRVVYVKCQTENSSKCVWSMTAKDNMESIIFGHRSFWPITYESGRQIVNSLNFPERSFRNDRWIKHAIILFSTDIKFHKQFFSTTEIQSHYKYSSNCIQEPTRRFPFQDKLTQPKTDTMKLTQSHESQRTQRELRVNTTESTKVRHNANVIRVLRSNRIGLLETNTGTHTSELVPLLIPLRLRQAKRTQRTSSHSHIQWLRFKATRRRSVAPNSVFFLLYSFTRQKCICLGMKFCCSFESNRRWIFFISWYFCSCDDWK